jgi:hypothetical protein
MPEADKKYERNACDEERDQTGSRDRGKNDIDVACQSQGQRHGSTGDKPASDPMDLFGILAREDDAVICGWCHREDHGQGDAAQAR